MRVHPRVTSIASIGQLTLAGPRLQVAGWHLASCCCSAPGSNNVPTARSSVARHGMLAMPRHERKAARKSRSFRRRQAPITRGQRRTLRELWPKYGLVMDFERRWDFDQIFAAAPGAAVTFDIGFGSGESLIEMAAARPKENFVGIEPSLLLGQVHKPGVAAALARLEAEGLPNVKIAQGDAITALADHIEDGSLSSCCIFFPDPFPQDRDTERRLVRPLLLSLLASKLQPGGALHVATDVDGYAEHTVRVMSTWTPEKWPQTVRPSLSPMPSRAAAAEGQELGLRQQLEERGVHRGEHLQGEEFTDGMDGPRQQQQGAGSKGDSTRLVSEASGCWIGGETAERPSWRPFTKYEEKAREAGRHVRDFAYRLELPVAPHPPPP